MVHCATILQLDTSPVLRVISLPPLFVDTAVSGWGPLMRVLGQFHYQIYKSHSLYVAVKARYALADRSAVSKIEPPLVSRTVEKERKNNM